MVRALSSLSSFFRNYMHHGKVNHPRRGPCHVLLARIHQLGWAWRFNDVFVDHQGLPIKLLRCPIQELKTRLRDGWQKRVLGIIQARPTFEGAPYMSPQITTASMNKFPLSSKPCCGRPLMVVSLQQIMHHTRTQMQAICVSFVRDQTVRSIDTGNAHTSQIAVKG